MVDISNITPPRVPFLEAGTQWISREWYRWLLNMFARQGTSEGDIEFLAAWTAANPVGTVADGKPSLSDLAPPSMGMWDEFLGTGPAAPAVAAMVRSGCDRLIQIVADGSSATMTLSGVPPGYTNLRLVVEGRSTDATVDAQTASILFNGDVTAGNYAAVQYLNYAASTAVVGTIAASAAGLTMLQLPGALNNTNAVGINDILIPAYNGGRYKLLQAKTSSYYGSGPTVRARETSGVWLKTDPILEITLTAGSGNWIANSTATLYGYR